MKTLVRKLAVFGELAVLLVAFSILTAPSAMAQEKPAVGDGQLTEESLGNLLKAMGLKPEKIDQRYDFGFKAVYREEEWDLSMTSVLSLDGQSIWVMAWLDELPRSAADVPRTALLRLLADNDRLGNGKFFAYVATNRRFVLQRVIPNQGLTTADFRNVLKDLGISVVETYPHWAVANWKSSSSSNVASEESNGTTGKPNAPSTATQPGRAPTRAANVPALRSPSRN